MIRQQITVMTLMIMNSKAILGSMQWDAKTFMFLLETILIPGGGFLGNIALRTAKRIPLSTGSDFLLLILVYSITIVSDPGIIKGVMRHGLSERLIADIHLTFAIVTTFVWFFSIFIVEPRVNRYYSKGDDKTQWFPIVSWIIPWIISSAIFVVYVYVLRNA